jgi:hypothetical protein
MRAYLGNVSDMSDRTACPSWTVLISTSSPLGPARRGCSTSAAAMARCCVDLIETRGVPATASKSTMTRAGRVANGINVIQINLEGGLTGFEDRFFDM